MIKDTSCKQISINDFIHPFGGTLSKENRWVKMVRILPWDEMVSVYIKHMSKKTGRKAVNPRVAIGALILKHMLRATDEDTIEFIKENPYLQYFLGYEKYRYERPFTPSLFVSIRRRLGQDQFEELTNCLMSYVQTIEASSKREKDNDRKPPNKGHLIVDATVSPADIKYPTDLDLLNDGREKSEQLIDLLYIPGKGKVKPHTYRQKARKDYLAATRQGKKRKKTIPATR